MKTSGGSDAAKRRAGESAAETVTDGEVVGLGTGSTAAHAIRRLGDRVDSGLDIRGVATSPSRAGNSRQSAGFPCSTSTRRWVRMRPGSTSRSTGRIRSRSAKGRGGRSPHKRRRRRPRSREAGRRVGRPLSRRRRSSKETPVLNRSVPVEVLPRPLPRRRRGGAKRPAASRPLRRGAKGRAGRHGQREPRARLRVRRDRRPGRAVDDAVDDARVVEHGSSSASRTRFTSGRRRACGSRDGDGGPVDFDRVQIDRRVAHRSAVLQK